MSKYDFDFDLYEDSTLAWIAQRINNESDVLEFGAANGRLTRFLKQVKTCAIDIVEIDEESGKEAASFARYSWIGDVEGDIEKYHWLENQNKYDYIVFADVLEHLINPEEVLKRCKNVLKEGGEILVSIPNISHNSVIIELLNDRFNYNSIGLLDNTHLRFFTRQSFIKMVEGIGLVITEERAKYIRVGETEIRNSYNDVPKRIFKELVKRENGDVYQYMFVLARSSEYLSGTCERKVYLGSSANYLFKIQYDQNGLFDYRKEMNCYVNPQKGHLCLCVEIPPDSSRCKMEFLNCSCITGVPAIWINTPTGKEMIEIVKDNAGIISDAYRVYNYPAELILALPKNARELELEIPIFAYDLEAEELEILLKLNAEKTSQIETTRDQLESTIKKYQDMVTLKEDELKQSINIYEEVVAQKDREFRQSVDIYERVVSQKDVEFKQSVDIYERELSKKDEEIKTLNQMNADLIQRVNSYEEEMNQLKEDLKRLREKKIFKGK